MIYEVKGLQGYLTHKKTPNPLGPPEDPRQTPTVVFWGGAFSCKRGTPVAWHLSPLNDRHSARQQGPREPLSACKHNFPFQSVAAKITTLIDSF